MRPVTCSEQARSAILPGFPARLFRKQECFVCLALDAVNVPIGKPWLVSAGTVNSVNVHPRDVFRAAIQRNAVAVIVAHNHPSGKADPSDDDLRITSRLREAGELLGIPVLDHLILTPDAGPVYSFSDNGGMR